MAVRREEIGHYFGDKCPGPDGPGHVDTLIDVIHSRSRVEEVNMNETHVSFETVDLNEIPPQRAKPRYAAIVQEFLDSGEQAVKLHLWEGATTTAVSGGLRTAATKNGFAVEVATRKGEVYLIRR